MLHLESTEPLRWLGWENWFALHGVATTGESHDLVRSGQLAAVAPPTRTQEPVQRFRQWIVGECAQALAHNPFLDKKGL